MKRVKKDTIKRTEFYAKYLKLINVILPKPLTQREIDVLSEFMKLKGDIVSLDRFGTQCRKIVRNKLGFKHASNIDNYIKYFKDKGILVINSKGILELNPRLFVSDNENTVELTFLFDIYDA